MAPILEVPYYLQNMPDPVVPDGFNDPLTTQGMMNQYWPQAYGKGSENGLPTFGVKPVLPQSALNSYEGALQNRAQTATELGKMAGIVGSAPDVQDRMKLFEDYVRPLRRRAADLMGQVGNESEDSWSGPAMNLLSGITLGAGTYGAIRGNRAGHIASSIAEGMLRGRADRAQSYGSTRNKSAEEINDIARSIENFGKALGIDQTKDRGLQYQADYLQRFMADERKAQLTPEQLRQNLENDMENERIQGTLKAQREALEAIKTPAQEERMRQELVAKAQRDRDEYFASQMRQYAQFLQGQANELPRQKEMAKFKADLDAKKGVSKGPSAQQLGGLKRTANAQTDPEFRQSMWDDFRKANKSMWNPAQGDMADEFDKYMAGRSNPNPTTEGNRAAAQGALQKYAMDAANQIMGQATAPVDAPTVDPVPSAQAPPEQFDPAKASPKQQTEFQRYRNDPRFKGLPDSTVWRAVINHVRN